MLAISTPMEQTFESLEQPFDDSERLGLKRWSPELSSPDLAQVVDPMGNHGARCGSSLPRDRQRRSRGPNVGRPDELHKIKAN
jgi:hypothetical protein